MVSLKSLIFGKSVIAIDSITEETREGIQKAYIPKWLFKPSYGFPRYANMSLIRWLAKTPYADMCITTILEEVKSIPWDIVIEPGFEELYTDEKGDIKPEKQKEIDHIKRFFENPNTNKETFEDVFIEMPLRDILEVNAGILNKVYNLRGDLVEVVARDGCLNYGSYIDTEQGILKIGEIVKNKLKVNVKSYNLETKEIEYKPVTEWFRNGTTTDWLKLTSISNSKHRNLTCTPNHKIYTKEGYKLAEELKTGDILYSYKSKLSFDEEQLIIGSLLGDGSLSKYKKDSSRHFFTITHSEKQKDYLLYKMESLERFNPAYSENYGRYNENCPETLKCRFKTESNLVFNSFIDLRYPLKKQIFDFLDLRSLAIWVMDDGHYYKYGSIELSTHRYPKEVLEYAQLVLSKKLGFKSKIRKDNRFDDAWILYFNKETTSEIILEIKDYIHPSMAYKVGLSSNEVGAKIEIKQGEGIELEEVELYKIEKISRYDTKYDIGVADNHNYFAHGKLISNSSFTKNPDIHGMFTDRVDLIIPKTIVNHPGEVVNEFEHIHASRVREDAAYFQYGWIAGPMPIPFGKKEIIWMEKMKRTDEIYGYSPVQVLANALQMLIWMIESDLEYFNDNNVPKGIIGLEDSDADEIKAFKDQWYNQQRTKDEFGNYKKMMHKVPIVNKIPKFTRIEFSASEMQLIEKQKWYSKMIWACFGVTGVELGYTEDAQGQANQIVQSKVFRKKAINPVLTKLSAHYNMEIVSEFEYEHLQFKFLVFDVDEERTKYELYKLQTESGLKTINECRHKEGDDPLEWGDKPPNEWKQSENSWNVGFDKPMSEREKEAQETDDNLKLPKNREETGKPKEDIPKNEKKSLSTEHHPLILSENEKPTGYKRLEKAILYVLKENEAGIKNILESEMKESAISGMKDINSVIDKIKSLLSFDSLKGITKAIIKNNYLKGWDTAEEQLDMNFMPDSEAIEYLSDYTFDNIKGMNDDIANKLRQELQRGFMEGEGITDIQERVSSVFNVGEVRAEMIARTEATRAGSAGKLHAYKKSGVKGRKRWLTHEDNRTSDICERLDGQEVALEADFTDAKTGWKGQHPPSHVNCRSDWIFITLDDDKKTSIKDIEAEERKIEEDRVNILARKKALEEKIVDKKDKLLNLLETELEGLI